MGVLKEKVMHLYEVLRRPLITEKNTEDILPSHEHSFIMNLDNKGSIVSGKTDVVLGHFHPIKYHTATEEELDHRHRLVLE